MSDLKDLNVNKVVKSSKRVLSSIDRESLDDLLTQLETDAVKVDVSDVVPIEITPEVKDRMLRLMDVYLQYREKQSRLNALKKEINGQIAESSRDLMTLMKLYGLTELIKDDKKFVLDQRQRRKPVKKDMWRQALEQVVKDENVVSKIYETAESMSEEQVVEKIKCVKYRENKRGSGGVGKN